MKDSVLNWQADEVKACIGPLAWEEESAFSESLSAYTQYYQIDFENQLPNVRHEIGYFDAHGFRITAHVFRVKSAKGTVIVQHGYYDHVGLYGHVIGRILQQGYNVFCYDLPGHGLSTGERAAITSFQQYDEVFVDGLEQCQRHMRGPISLVGQSTGGAIIINYLLSRHINRDNSPFAGIYLMAPLVRPVGWRASMLFYYLCSKFIKQLKRTFTENSNNPSFVEFISCHDPLQPLYLKVSWVKALKDWINFIENSPPVDLDIRVLQGTDDGTVDFRHNLKVLAKKFMGYDVTFIDGGRHHLANEEPEHLKQVMSFLTL